MGKAFYVTTPIYYPNDVPHIGHAYTTLAADVLARWHRLRGKEVFFLTGSDDHGKKIADAAKKAGKSPQEFTDALVLEFKKAWEILGIDYSRFIRTTEEDHTRVVQDIIKKVYAKGDIYKGMYEGLYCTGCEAYYTEKDAVDGKCPIHQKKLEYVKEESYFFKLSKYQQQLLDLYKKNPEFISPEKRRQEIINRVQEGLKDFSISRKSFDWGVAFPLEEGHVTYVWFDALINYLSGVGFLEDKKKFKKFWPADVHLVGKDILWFHSVYWPAMLLSAGIALPEKVFAHGWWTFNQEKISKSRGKVISVPELAGIAGVDAARYFLFRECPFGDDGDFSAKMLIERYHTELANKLGNLVSRVAALGEKYGFAACKNTLLSSLDAEKISQAVENLAFDKALHLIFAFIDRCNTFVQEKKPWVDGNKEVLYQLADSIKAVALLLWPFLPSTGEKIAQQFGFKILWGEFSEPFKGKITKGEILFKKVESG